LKMERIIINESSSQSKFQVVNVPSEIPSCMAIFATAMY